MKTVNIKSVAIVSTLMIPNITSAQEWQQRAIRFDFDKPGEYEVAVMPDQGNVICAITFNEFNGSPRESPSPEWQYYSIEEKISDTLGKIKVKVPCPDGSIPASELVEIGRDKVNDQTGQKVISLVQRQLRSCIGGGAERKGEFVVAEMQNKQSCPPASHFSNLEEWKQW